MNLINAESINIQPNIQITNSNLVVLIMMPSNVTKQL